MCGIAGIVRFDGSPVEPAVLGDMLEVLAHRGPDDEGMVTEGPVTLGMKRLSIIDLAGGHQPMRAGPATLVYNGELYNYLELRSELEQRGHRFETRSDTEVILRAYLEWGPDSVSRLNGMFAFLLHDRAAGRLIAVRDRFGIKPLYLTRDSRGLYFASEIKALFEVPGVRPEPDWDAVREYLTFQYVLGWSTLFRGVEKLPPAHYLVVDTRTGASRAVRYWDPAFEVDSLHSAEFFASRVRHLLEDAVHLQLRSDVPVGTYLSGGMDSSLVTALASRSASGLQSFVGRFGEGPEFDESPYARLLAQACGVTLHETVATREEFFELMPRLIWHMDEPAAGPGIYPQYLVSRRASQSVKVMLGGQGGDEIFGGYARYVVAYLEQALKGAIYETNEEGKHIVSLDSIVPNLPALRAYTPMMQQFWRQGMFEPMDRRYFHLVDRIAGAVSLFTPEFRDRYDRERIFQRFARIFNRPDTKSYYNKMTAFDLTAGLPALLQVEDRVSMAVSLESRVPLLDHRLVELVAGIPVAFKFHGGQMKHILRRATADLLPPAILQRKDKMGFPVPLHVWFRAGRGREWLEDLLLSPGAAIHQIFDQGEIRKLMDYQRAYSRRVWGLLSLELWFRTFIKRPQPGPAEREHRRRARARSRSRTRPADAADAG